MLTAQKYKLGETGNYFQKLEKVWPIIFNSLKTKKLKIRLKVLSDIIFIEVLTTKKFVGSYSKTIT